LTTQAGRATNQEEGEEGSEEELEAKAKSS
jgi:hypothetical protein